MNKEDEILKVLPKDLQDILTKAKLDFRELQEVRLRVNMPFIVFYKNTEYFVGADGNLLVSAAGAYEIAPKQLRETVELISNYSLYAYEDEIRQGFITIQGGHRVGLTGKIIVENGTIKSMKYISFLNIRLAHQIKGCGSSVLPYVIGDENVYHTLIISPPRCGKTTLLRDLIRQISNGQRLLEGKTVGVVDERSEIGACYLGIPQNDLGVRTDILDCCPKADGMLMMIRSMAPEVIAVDEIGSREDLSAIEYVINCGCKIIATVHGGSIEDIKQKPVLRKLVEEKVFERYVILSHKHLGQAESVFDAMGNPIYIGDMR